MPQRSDRRGRPAAVCGFPFWQSCQGHQPLPFNRLSLPSLKTIEPFVTKCARVLPARALRAGSIAAREWRYAAAASTSELRRKVRLK